MSIFNSNDFKRGFKDGENDAIKDNDKSYAKSGFSLKFALHGDNAINTYIKGYDTGYLEGLKEKRIIRKVEIIPNKTQAKIIKKTENKQNINTFFNNQNNNIMSLQKIELQLEALYQLKAFLVEFEAELKEKHNQYNDRVHALKENGLPDEVYVNLAVSVVKPINFITINLQVS